MAAHPRFGRCFSEETPYCFTPEYFSALARLAATTAARSPRRGSEAPCALSAAMTVSVDTLPARTSRAKGKPPTPPMADSKRRQPARPAAGGLAGGRAGGGWGVEPEA